EARQQGNESYRIEYLFPDADRRRLDDCESLHAALARFRARERQHHATACLEILQQRGGHVRSARRYDDRVDLEFFAEIGAAVAMRQARIADSERLQVPSCLVDERRDALDRVNGFREPREDGRLIAA